MNKSYGLRVEVSRFNQIIGKIAGFPNDKHDAKDLWALSELDDLYRAYKYLEKYVEINPKLLANIKKKAIKGHIYLEAEKISGDSNNGRDFLFELLMASNFTSNKIDVSFFSDADFSFYLPDGRTVFAECKRVKSLGSLDFNIYEALGQINRRGSDKDAGIVFISLSRLIWEQFNGNFVCGNLGDIESFVSIQIDTIMQKVRLAYNYHEYSKTVAVIAHCKIPIVDIDSNDVYFFSNSKCNLKFWEMHLDAPWSIDYMKNSVLALFLPKWIRGC